MPIQSKGSVFVHRLRASHFIHESVGRSAILTNPIPKPFVSLSPPNTKQQQPDTKNETFFFMAGASTTSTNGPANNTNGQPSSSAGAAAAAVGAGNVRVVARIRPLSSREKAEPEIMTSLDDRLVQVKMIDQKRFFELDRVFGVYSTQQQVYDGSGAREAVTNDLFAGFNCTVREGRVFLDTFCSCLIRFFDTFSIRCASCPSVQGTQCSSIRFHLSSFISLLDLPWSARPNTPINIIRFSPTAKRERVKRTVWARPMPPTFPTIRVLFPVLVLTCSKRSI